MQGFADWRDLWAGPEDAAIGLFPALSQQQNLDAVKRGKIEAVKTLTGTFLLFTVSSPIQISGA